ncbi:hypothetical protein [Marinisporobacter balticus]|uniref:Uncharacterized protein n=1 Tax=Marinisporobacter balticus TaxID=2018667 RepID=A0A4R2L8T5_9FIRM|nr:hypothetical protein [Marinisporobacter balticus]TCO79128.1 hypothetical protein EV214_103180 [Marinisporobacter balticus]
MKNLCSKKEPLFRMNLQLFAEGEAGETGGGESSVAPSFSEATNNFMASLEAGESTGDTQTGENENVSPQDNEPPIDQQTNKKGQQNEQQEDEFDILGFLNNMHQEQQQINQRLENIQNPPQQEPQKTPEELEAERTAYAEQLADLQYTDPIAYREAIMQEAKEQALAEFQAIRQQEIIQQQQQYQEQQKWNNTFETFKKDHADVDKYLPKMIELLQQNPHYQQDKDPYSLAYTIAKTQDTQANTPPTTLEGIMQSDQFKQQLAQNPEARKLILESMKNNQAPPVIGGGTGTTSVTPQNKPKSFKEATKGFLEWANAQE